MKNVLIAILVSLVCFGAETNTLTTSIHLSLKWDANPVEDNIKGYWTTMSQGTNNWKVFTTNTQVRLTDINSNIKRGFYNFSVEAVSVDNIFSLPSTNLSTFITKQPFKVINLRLEIE